MNVCASFAYDETRNQILDRLSKGDPIDIVSVDQIGLGEFVGIDQIFLSIQR